MNTIAPLFTVGHSTHSHEHFLDLLRQHGITAVADVRSRPYSRMNPQFNRDEVEAVLRRNGMKYVFLGEELGARSEDPACYKDGKVQYDRLSKTELFRRGLERVRDGMSRYVLALMCAEKEPLECHRSILVARYLVADGVPVLHIHADRTIEPHADAIQRLIGMLKIPGEHMFRTAEDVWVDAYRKQGERIAYEAAQNAESGATLESML